MSSRKKRARWAGRTLTQGAEVGRNIETGELKASSAPENAKTLVLEHRRVILLPDSSSAERPDQVLALANTEFRRDRAGGAR